MLLRSGLLLFGLFLAIVGQAAEEISYAVDLKDPPPNTFIYLGSADPKVEGKKSKIGESLKFDLAIETHLNIHEKKADIAEKHASLLAHAALHNAKRIESMLKDWPEAFDQARLKVRRVSLGVVSVSDFDRDGVKWVRIELTIAINMDVGHYFRASQRKHEVWEFDGKQLKLVEAPEEWSFIAL